MRLRPSSSDLMPAAAQVRAHAGISYALRQ
jgi:hypothetical protein